MRAFIDWLLGERASRSLTAIWNWLWGLPIESGGKVAVEVAQVSLQAMQQSVSQLAESVAQITASYQQAKKMYDTKQQEFKQAEEQAFLAHRNGNEEAARLAMSRAIALERLLPQLAEQVAQASKVLQASRDKLSREWQRLETYKVELQNLKDFSVVSEALAAISKVNRDLDLDSARSQFEQAQVAVQGRYLQKNALAELAENPTEKLIADVDKLTLDAEISRRLKSLDESSES